MTVFQFRRYNADQPRHPAGSSEGGRWAPKGGSSMTEIVGEGSVLSARRGLGDEVKPPSRDELERGFDPVPSTPHVESTLLDHMDADGNLTPERQKVHDELIRKFTSGSDGNPLPSQVKPKALMMGGGAAAGKTSAIEAGHVDSPPDHVLVNPDEFKLEIPESKGKAKDGRDGDGLADKYGDAWAGIVHEESSHLGKRLIAGAMDRRQNILIDKTSDNGPKAVRQIQALQQRGYDVEVAYVTTDVDRAVGAALQRQETTGRKVPETVLRNAHRGANTAFLHVAAESDVPVKLVTTTAPNPDGSFNPPVLTAESDGKGNVTVHDPDHWVEYLGRIEGGIPEKLKITDRLSLVASAGTMAVEEVSPKMIDSDRMKVLYGNAVSGTTPSNMTAEETAAFESLKTEIAEIKAANVSPDFPIDDLFADDGVVAVLDKPTRRKFRSG